MDYKTHPTTREELRKMAKGIRQMYKCKNKYRFDVVNAFERTSLLFPEITCIVVEDDEFDQDIPARCTPDMNGHYLIEVKNSVYEGAVQGKGGYRAHILHEICHAILCIWGFTPILDRAFKNKQLRAYESMEWQAKALCGEIMIPYEETAGLSVRKIMGFCKVSRDCAAFRYREFGKAPETISDILDDLF